MKSKLLLTSSMVYILSQTPTHACDGKKARNNKGVKTSKEDRREMKKRRLTSKIKRLQEKLSQIDDVETYLDQS